MMEMKMKKKKKTFIKENHKEKKHNSNVSYCKSNWYKKHKECMQNKVKGESIMRVCTVLNSIRINGTLRYIQNTYIHI